MKRLPGDSGFGRRLSDGVGAWLALTLVGMGLVAALPARAGLAYVNASAGGARDGTSWVNAYTNLADALAAATDGSVYWVAAGTYANSATFTQSQANVSIYGGFAGNETALAQRNISANPTVLDGANARQILVISATNVVLDGLTLTRGYAQNGGAILNTGAGLIVRNCVVIANVNNGGDYRQGGAGIQSSVSMTIQDSQIVGNTNTFNDYGGAVFLTGGSLLAQRTDFIRNYNKEQNTGQIGNGCGGAINVGGGSLTAINCSFVGNTSDGGSNARGSRGGAIYFGNATASLIANCTFLANATFLSTNVSGGGAIYVSSGSAVVGITNCIFWGNQAGSGASSSSILNAGTVNLAYCDLDTNGVSGGTVNYGAGIINADPLLVSGAAPYDLHEMSRQGHWAPAAPGGWANDAVSSPCIDAGSPASPYDLEPSYNGRRINLGRYGNTSEASRSNPTAVENGAVIAMNNTDAYVTGLLYTDGTAHDVRVYWGMSNGANNPSAWASNALVGSYADPVNAFTNLVTGLSGISLYYVTFRATNAFDDVWATNVLSFMTPAAAGQPVVSNTAPTALQDTSATMNGILAQDGGEPPAVWLFYGQSNGGSVKTNWAAAVPYNGGAATGVGLLSTNIAGLAPATTYYYRYYASNSAFDAWALPVESFTTYGLPGVANVAPVPGVGTATMEGQLTATNGADTTVGIAWGATLGGTSTGSWANVATFGSQAQGAIVSNVVGGLTYGVRYYYRTFASNRYGTNWAATEATVLTLKPAGTGVTNTPATGVATTSAAINATLQAAGSVYDVWANWWQMPGGATNSVFLGTWTNVASTNLSYALSGLTMATTYAFSFRVANQAEDVTALPAMPFKTYGPPGVDNGGGASDVSAVSATLNGTLLDGVQAAVTIYWGPTPGGTDKTAWSHATPTVTVGEGLFSQTVPVTPLQTNYYRCYASNAFGEAWAPDTLGFTSPSPFYVKLDAVGLPEDGSSWDNAFRTLTNALARTPSGAAFWVAQGTQTWGNANGMVVTTHTILGGFAGTEIDASRRNWTLHPTVLDGQGLRRAFNKTAAGAFTLDGVIVQNAYSASDGGAMYCNGGSLAIYNCVFANSIGGFQGGAIYQGQSGVVNVFSNCRFVANSTTLAGGEHGGAIHFNTASTNVFRSCAFVGNCTRNGYKLGGAIYEGGTGGLLLLTGCVFADNSATGPGGAIYSRGTLDLSGGNNDFRGNVSAYDGGAIYGSVQGTHTFNQTAFVANSGQGGGALFFFGASTISLVNCTFFTNTATTGHGGAVNSGSGVVAATNCIFWGNASAGSGTDLYGNGTVAIAYSDIDTNAGSVVDGTKYFGVGITNADPLFAGAVAPYDVHLQSEYGRWTPAGWVSDAVSSPCIDAGDPRSPFDVEPMSNGGRINMGFDGNTSQASRSKSAGTVLILW